MLCILDLGSILVLVMIRDISAIIPSIQTLSNEIKKLHVVFLALFEVDSDFIIVEIF